MHCCKTREQALRICLQDHQFLSHHHHPLHAAYTKDARTTLIPRICCKVECHSTPRHLCTLLRLCSIMRRILEARRRGPMWWPRCSTILLRMHVYQRLCIWPRVCEGSGDRSAPLGCRIARPQTLSVHEILRQARISSPAVMVQKPIEHPPIAKLTCSLAALPIADSPSAASCACERRRRRLVATRASASLGGVSHDSSREFLDC